MCSDFLFLRMQHLSHGSEVLWYDAVLFFCSEDTMSVCSLPPSQRWWLMKVHTVHIKHLIVQLKWGQLDRWWCRSEGKTGSKRTVSDSPPPEWTGWGFLWWMFNATVPLKRQTWLALWRRSLPSSSPSPGQIHNLSPSKGCSFLQYCKLQRWCMCHIRWRVCNL